MVDIKRIVLMLMVLAASTGASAQYHGEDIT